MRKGRGRSGLELHTPLFKEPPPNSGLTSVPHAGRRVGSAVKLPTPSPGFNLWDNLRKVT